MWEKILLAAAVTFSVHVFAGIDISDLKSPLASSSPAIPEESKDSTIFSFPETAQFSKLANINTFFKK